MSCKECGSGEIYQVKAIYRHTSNQLENLRKKVEETFNALDKLAHDDAITDKQFVYHAGFLMSQLLDQSRSATIN